MKYNMSKARSLTAALSLIGSLVGGVNAAVLSNGDLVVTIRDDNGAIDSAVYDGVDFFGQGAHVSDYGFQNGTDTASYVRNTTDGATGQAVVASGTNFSGTYAPSGISFTRSYELVPGFDVLKITTNFTNDGFATTLRYFDTFDPDQGEPLTGRFDTNNDVFTLGDFLVGRARITGASDDFSVTMGSSNPNVTVASGGPFQINDGSTLNTFFNSPVDGGDSLADMGTHIGYEYTFAPNESTELVTYVSFGTTPVASDAGISGVAAVPEPSSSALVALGGLALALRRRR